jgi:hypothetical protein
MPKFTARDSLEATMKDTESEIAERDKALRVAQTSVCELELSFSGTSKRIIGHIIFGKPLSYCRPLNQRKMIIEK